MLRRGTIPFTVPANRGSYFERLSSPPMWEELMVASSPNGKSHASKAASSRLSFSEAISYNEGSLLGNSHWQQKRTLAWIRGATRGYYRRATGFAKKHWFPLAIPCVVAFGLTQPQWLNPSPGAGYLHSALWRDFLVPMMFFCTGLGLPIAVMASALAAVRVHLFVQLLSFALCPAVGAAFLLGGSKLVNPEFTLFPTAEEKKNNNTVSSSSSQRGIFGLRREFILGGLFVCCLPTTVGLSTACARTLGANVPVTIVNSVVGNFAGIALTPLVFCQITSMQTSMDPMGVFQKLALSVVAPLVLGIALRKSGALLQAKTLDRVAPYLGPFQQSCILAMLGIVISQHAGEVRKNVQLREVPALLATIVMLYAMVFHLGLGASRFVPRADTGMRVAATLSGTQKTAAMGISIVTLLFADDPALPLIAFPLLCYHPSQVGLSTMMAQNAMRRNWFRLY